MGLPGFQFIQDPVEYDTRTHHSNMDTYERIQEADMRQNAVIVAAFVYQTANRDEKLPRKPLPRAQPAGRGTGGRRLELTLTWQMAISPPQPSPCGVPVYSLALVWTWPLAAHLVDAHPPRPWRSGAQHLDPLVERAGRSVDRGLVEPADLRIRCAAPSRSRNTSPA